MHISQRSHFQNFEDVFQFQNCRLGNRHQFCLQEVQSTFVFLVPVHKVLFSGFKFKNILLFVIYCANEIQFTTYKFTSQNSTRKERKIKSGKDDRKCEHVSK